MKTLDIYLSAYLYLNGANPTLQMVNGKVYFVFEDSGRTSRLNDDYISNKSVPVADYVTCIKTLRSKMLTLKQGG